MKNEACPYYPCHELKGDNFSCDECYCPEYPCLDPKLGKMLDNGLWDCSNCIKYHQKDII